ncbi:SsrA-binding protein [Frondihabitans sp. PhB188]|uniref:SsrA-binding protein SmpB n=1 Tax=Frondihabitans sp. PhB188 TaxID=2485200 RepID=UPI000F48EA8F|nr:SsrA-binding protein SmpB [Frondihabitans sp. PhB188]ROQ41378.1 SsrA-binding protein [Frondihabitans sp. PhB188]
MATVTSEKRKVSDRDKGEKVVATNRRARHDYLIDDTYEAGIVLWGTEVKALRQGRASLVDGYAFVDGGEIWLDAVHIPEYTEGTWNNHAPRRKRKLLLHKQQIIKISHKTKEGGYTLVPLRIYFSDGRAKVEIAVAKGKREYDKRQTLRERTDRREADRAMSARRNLGD